MWFGDLRCRKGLRTCLWVCRCRQEENTWRRRAYGVMMAFVSIGVVMIVVMWFFVVVGDAGTIKTGCGIFYKRFGGFKSSSVKRSKTVEILHCKASTLGTVVPRRQSVVSECQVLLPPLLW